MGQVFYCTGGAKIPNNHNFFLINDLEAGGSDWLSKQETSLDDCAGA